MTTTGTETAAKNRGTSPAAPLVEAPEEERRIHFPNPLEPLDRGLAQTGEMLWRPGPPGDRCRPDSADGRPRLVDRRRRLRIHPLHAGAPGRRGGRRPRGRTAAAGFAVLAVSRLDVLGGFGLVLAGSVLLALLAAWLLAPAGLPDRPAAPGPALDPAVPDAAPAATGAAPGA